jgi:hypothetical protein
MISYMCDTNASFEMRSVAGTGNVGVSTPTALKAGQIKNNYKPMTPIMTNIGITPLRYWV